MFVPSFPHRYHYDTLADPALDSLIIPWTSAATEFRGGTSMFQSSSLEFYVFSHGLDERAAICPRLLCVWYVSAPACTLVSL